MELAVVIGQVVSTVKCPGIQIERLLLVDFVDSEGKPRGEPAALSRTERVTACWIEAPPHP